MYINDILVRNLIVLISGGEKSLGTAVLAFPSEYESANLFS